MLAGSACAGAETQYGTEMLSRALRATSALAFVLAAIAACKSASLAPQGGECALATDCEPGLVCLAKGDGTTRSCESDLTAVTNPVPPNARDGGEGGLVEEGDGAAPVLPADGGPIQDTSTPPVDSSVPDTSTGTDAADAAG